MRALETQREAREAIEASGTAGELREAVYSLLEATPNLTCREIAKEVGREPHVISARISELEKAGKIKKNGVKVCSISNRNVTQYLVGKGEEQKGTRINMKMGVSFNDKTKMWVVYLDGKIVTSVAKYSEAGEIMRKAYLEAKGLESKEA